MRIYTGTYNTDHNAADLIGRRAVSQNQLTQLEEAATATDLIGGIIICQEDQLFLQNLLAQLEKAATELLSPGHHVGQISHPLQVLRIRPP
jgi:hypothetical protein